MPLAALRLDQVGGSVRSPGLSSVIADGLTPQRIIVVVPDIHDQESVPALGNRRFSTEVVVNTAAVRPCLAVVIGIDDRRAEIIGSRTVNRDNYRAFMWIALLDYVMHGIGLRYCLGAYLDLRGDFNRSAPGLAVIGRIISSLLLKSAMSKPTS